jgi:hypothetical protein
VRRILVCCLLAFATRLLTWNRPRPAREANMLYHGEIIRLCREVPSQVALDGTCVHERRGLTSQTTKRSSLRRGSYFTESTRLTNVCCPRLSNATMRQIHLLRLQLVYLQVFLNCFASFESSLSPSRGITVYRD